MISFSWLIVGNLVSGLDRFDDMNKKQSGQLGQLRQLPRRSPERFIL
jgi:hypothetical protein